MAIILNIDTAVGAASVCLAKDATPLQYQINRNQQDHASWMHKAIETMMKEQEMKWGDLQAISVTIGPGSYTGLRVGLSAAKGLCFALKIPLVTVNTLFLMADASSNENRAKWICPMIDARRMEVFTAVYDSGLKEEMPPAALILEQNSFSKWIENGKMLFVGNGVEKLKKLVNHPNAIFSELEVTAKEMCSLSEKLFNNENWSDLAYTEPFYLKEFHNPLS